MAASTTYCAKYGFGEDSDLKRLFCEGDKRFLVHLLANGFAATLGDF